MDEGGNIIVMRRICRPGGYITVEASFVFPIIFFIIFGLLKFGFCIYNNVVDNSLKVYMGLRVREIEKNYFNPVAQEIDLKRIANEGDYTDWRYKRRNKHKIFTGKDKRVQKQCCDR